MTKKIMYFVLSIVTLGWGSYFLLNDCAESIIDKSNDNKAKNNLSFKNTLSIPINFIFVIIMELMFLFNFMMLGDPTRSWLMIGFAFIQLLIPVYLVLSTYFISNIIINKNISIEDELLES